MILITCPRLVKSEVRHVSFDGFYLFHKDVPISRSLLCLRTDLPFYVFNEGRYQRKGGEQVRLRGYCHDWGHQRACTIWSMGLSLGVCNTIHDASKTRAKDFLSRHACGKKTTHACPWMFQKYFPGCLFARRAEPETIASKWTVSLLL